MKRLQILAAFELEVNKLDDAINKPVTDDSLYWINQAALKFAKERFNGNAPHYTSYEQNEKRTRDLHNLYNRVRLLELTEPSLEQHAGWSSRAMFGAQLFKWPEDLMYILNEDVIISDNNDGNLYDTSVFECTADNFMYRITNSLTDFHYRHHKARPLRVRIGVNDDGSQNIALLHDKNYRIQDYWISYLKYPILLNNEDPDTNPENKSFPDDVWQEIIKIAAQMYVENQSEDRYKTLSAEVMTQE